VTDHALSVMAESGELAIIETGCPNVRVARVDELASFKPEDRVSDTFAYSWFRKRGVRTFKSENALWTVIWTFLYWDEIFSRIPEGYDERMGDAYPVPGNDIPRDLFQPDFQYPRRTAYRDRRNALLEADLSAMVERAYGKTDPGVTRLLQSLPTLSIADIKSSLDVFSNESILRVLDRLWVDYSENRSGLPDLCVLGPTPCLVEVKGPKDSVRANQCDWLRYLGGNCGFDTYVLVEGWSERKAANLAKRLGGPAGKLTVEYGHSASKFFREVEDLVDRWPIVERSGEGRSLEVHAELPLSRVGEAKDVLEKVVLWKSARARIDGAPTEMTSDSPLRCLAERELCFAGSDYCTRLPYYSKRIGPVKCKRFEHAVVQNGELAGFGVINPDLGVFQVDLPAIEEALEEQCACLQVCPYFKPKQAEKAFTKLPSSIDPAADNNWAWVDSEDREWFFEKGEWFGAWGLSEFPGVGAMESVRKTDSAKRALIRRNRRAELRLEKEYEQAMAAVHHGEEVMRGPTTKRPGCSLLLILLVLVGAALLFLN